MEIKTQQKQGGAKLMTEQQNEELEESCPENYTLYCGYKDKKTGEVMGCWEEPFPNKEVAEELFRRLLLISNNYEYIY